MKKKTIIIMVIVLLVVVVIGLYGTYATSIVASNTNDTYNVTLNNSLQEITIPSGSSKTIIYHITNINNGIVQYGVVYSGSNITVKIYNDSENSATGTFDYGENKYIKLYITNSGTSDSTASIKTVLGYENGGDLIIPSGYTLVSEVYVTYKGLAKLIAKDMFTPNTTVTNNSITYNYDTTHSLMEDVGENIRYYGKSKFVGTVPAWQSDDTKSTFGNFDSDESCLAEMANYNICSPDIDGYENYGYSDQATCEAEYDWGDAMLGESMTYNEGKEKYCTGTANKYELVDPNNYIYFNCSDYSNQSDSTCEKWRIIGVFEGKVKIMRNEVIGRYSWDNKDKTTGAETDWGKNDWTDARLMKLLNPGYESETIGGSLYYNSGSGTCYIYQNNATSPCDFTSTGIKNDITRNLISDTLYYLGGWNTSSVYSDQIYGYERGTTTWRGKIALAYPSDYGYAADLESCTKPLWNNANSTCASTNWMKPILGTNNWGWLLTPNSRYSHYVWYVDSFGLVRNIGVDLYGANMVAPVLYLGSEQEIESGTGTSSDPYKLSV